MNQDIYVMRVWHESEHWRVSVTDTRSGEKYNFANLDRLVAFLKERLEPPTPDTVRGATVK